MVSTQKLWTFGLCPMCKREARGFLYLPPPGVLRRKARFCSMRCMDDYMIDKSPNEQIAMNEAAAAAGHFIEASGVYNFLEFKPDQFDQFIEAIVTAYVESLQDQKVETEGVRFP